MDEPPIRALYIGDLADRAQGSKPTPKLTGTRDVIRVYVGVQCVEKLKPKLRQELNISVNLLFISVLERLDTAEKACLRSCAGPTGSGQATGMGGCRMRV